MNRLDKSRPNPTPHLFRETGRRARVNIWEEEQNCYENTPSTYTPAPIYKQTFLLLKKSAHENFFFSTLPFNYRKTTRKNTQIPLEIKRRGVDYKMERAWNNKEVSKNVNGLMLSTIKVLQNHYKTVRKFRRFGRNQV